MTDDREERRVQPIADALRQAIERQMRSETLAPLTEAGLLGQEPAADEEPPPPSAELVGAAASDGHFFG